MTSLGYRRKEESNNTRQVNNSYILPESSVTLDVKCSIPLDRDDNSVSKDRLLKRTRAKERKKERKRERKIEREPQLEKEREREKREKLRQKESIINKTYICSNKVSLSPFKDLSWFVVLSSVARSVSLGKENEENNI